MINLIKNELIKVFHKKFIYIILAIVLVLSVLGAGITKIATDIIDSSTEVMNKQILDSYDLNDPMQVADYVRDKTEYENQKIINKFDENSWQKLYLMNNYSQISLLQCIYENEYITKDKVKKDECQKELDNNLKDFEEKDYLYFETKSKTQLENEKIDLEEQLKNVSIENEKDNLNKQISIINEKIKVIEYRIKNKVSPLDKKYLMTDTYILNIDKYFNRDIDKYKNSKKQEDKIELMNIERDYEISKYDFEHNKIEQDYMAPHNLLITESKSFIFFALIVAIGISGSILADEFNKGTIKQLLVRPYSRTKIIISKYITILLVLFMFIIMYFGLEIIIYGVFFGFDNLFNPVTVYNYATKEVFEMNFILHLLINFISTLPIYLTLISAAMLFAVITGNPALSNIVPFIIFYGSSIVEGVVAIAKVKLFEFLYYLPFFNWNLNSYLYGGVSNYKMLNFGISLAISLITIVLLIGVSIRLFSKKDIKNI